MGKSPLESKGSQPVSESTTSRGRWAEQLVAEHLRKHGLEIVAVNHRTLGAELDLVAREGETAVFVEVRSRRSAELGHPLETINQAKKRQIIRGATEWLIENDLWERVAVRFDVVAVLAPKNKKNPEVQWLRDAFEA